MDRKIEKKRWTTKTISIYSTAALFTFLIIYMIFFGDSKRNLNVEVDRLSVSTVKSGPFQEFTPVTGVIQPIETFQLDVTDGGKVVKKYVEEGAFLNIGDPIVSLDNPQLRLNIIYNEANVYQQINNLRSTRLSFQQSKLDLQGRLLQNNIDLRKQKRNYLQNKELYDKGLGSKNDYLEAKDEYEYLLNYRKLILKTYEQDSVFRAEQISQLEVSVRTLQSNLNITKQQLENLTVRAPIKGQLTALNAEIGQSISAGENIGQIDKVDSFKVKVNIDEYWIARVEKGQKGSFTFAGKDYRLRVKKVFPQVSNGVFQVDMIFAGFQPEGIRRGQTIHIKLELGEQSNAIYIDRGGFYQTTGGQWIFVVDPSGKFATRRNIKLGRQNTQYYEVLEGLKPGEKVITSSYDNYDDIEKLILKQ